MTEPNQNVETIVLGGGCFWCLDPIFNNLKGVQEVAVGYAGGKKDNPGYEEVCSGSTGHAEVVQIRFDPAQISFKKILDVFFSVHDPTTLNRQGADVGSQYRSIILYTTEDQKMQAEETIRQLNASNKFSKQIVTQVVPLTQFYPGEEYHQRYFEKNPYAGYCQVVIRPKWEKFQEKFIEDRKK